MKYLDVIRLEYGDDGIIGMLRFDNKILPNMYTLELPYNKNLPYISSIPVGHYEAQIVTSPMHGDAISLLNVPNRTHILFHIGNTIDDLQGCIAVGNSIGDDIKNSRGLIRDRGLMRSKRALGKLIKLLLPEDFGVRIADFR